MAHLKNAVAEAALSVGAVLRLPVPAEAAGGRAGREVEAAETTHEGVRRGQRVRAAARLVGVGGGHLLAVPAVAHGDVHGAARVQRVVEHPVGTLVRVHLTDIVQTDRSLSTIVLVLLVFSYKSVSVRKYRLHGR